MPKPSREGSTDLPEFIHELGMELGDALNPVRARSEERGPEVQRSLLLPEAGAWDDADTRGVQKAHTVELVRRAVLGGSGGDGLWRKLDGGEEVHGTLDG